MSSNTNANLGAATANRNGAVSEEIYLEETPYTAPTEPKKNGTLPPIAMARPVHPGDVAENAAPTADHPTGSNIPTVRAEYMAANGAPLPPPQGNVRFMTTTVAAVLNGQFEYIARCRWIAGFMLCYYVATFFFLQPFFLGTMGMMTGFIGYYGSRPPVLPAHIKWMRCFVWMNYVLLVLNIWMAIVSFMFIDPSTADARYGILSAIVIGCNMLLHVRGVQIGQQYYAELLRAWPLSDHAVVMVTQTVIVLEGNNRLFSSSVIGGFRPTQRTARQVTMLLRRPALSQWRRVCHVLRAYNQRLLFSSSAGHRVLFFGTDDVSVATLKKLHDKSQQPEAVVGDIEVICPSDRKVGRGKRTDPVPVKRFALDHGLTVHHTPAHLKTLRNWEMPTEGAFDVGVVVSFGYKLHPHMLAPLRYGAINMHPSLLPKYRGPAPIHHALLNGDSVTGVSVIEIDPMTFDVGRILLQKEVPVPEGITCSKLSSALADFGADCVLETLQDLPASKANARSQDNALATKAAKIKLEDGYLQLHETANQVFHRWQALSDSVGVSVTFKDTAVKLTEVRHPTAEELVVAQQEEAASSSVFPAGAFFFDKKLNALWLKCSNNTWLLVTKLQEANRRIGDARDFANGHRLQRLLHQFQPISSAST
ncbi:TPA: hypothetical protein N0F65_012643 [Lagenidium giganteum]|uniref:Methionyl-tRNA formyltransferase, mitochondrial n=1 Tax=Lagenidium giganteum TaxID=4803 RepID=A0AAV2YN88_9STRA|nr:TPA: hypothetical protein N0F65_012643 [Lagenidium giganteum]